MTLTIMGTIGEFLSDWPRVALLGMATLGGLLVGVGILKESERWSVAAIMVLAGIVIEPIATLGLFMYDESVSRAQNAELSVVHRDVADAQRETAKANERAAQLEKETAEARSKIADADARAAEASQKAAEAQIALEKFKAARTLTQIQQDILVSALKPFAPQEYALSVGQGKEPENFLCLLDSVLQRADWIKIEHFGTMSVDTACGVAAVNTVSGVHIRAPLGTPYTPGHGANAAAAELARLLNSFDIAAFPAFDPKNIPKANAINLMVGTKP